MCTRYFLTSTHEDVRKAFAYLNQEPFPPRYNIAPSQPVAIVRLDHRRQRELTLVRWGLIPSWLKDPSKVSLMINARAETAEEKLSFRGPMRHRRCLVPADGYYEWIGEAGERRPHLVRPRQGGPIALAGLWDHWLGADGSEIETLAILTVGANATIGALHDRMPAIVQPADYQAWLDVGSGRSSEAAALLAPTPDAFLEVIEVSAKVNNPRNEGPEIQQPV